jgi:hypothetical protein
LRTRAFSLSGCTPHHCFSLARNAGWYIVLLTFPGGPLELWQKTMTSSLFLCKFYTKTTTAVTRQQQQDLLSAIIATAVMTGSGVGLPLWLFREENL